ncbi:Scr1 family TA system antitoxin-like transcriptional regulator, partial [Kitasatospora sp. NPDC059747]|uniref:Scr1 family TA system antitoxin-like transcriptional regulator n=1 Tax=Kitasatospora sp. NPDC059747 TaxID=3346930 RepID=UPI0036504D01
PRPPNPPCAPFPPPPPAPPPPRRLPHHPPAQNPPLLEVGELANVTIKVVPFSAGLHLGVMSGPFGILRFPLNGDGSETEPPTVYADGYTGDLYLDKPGEVERYDAAFKNIWETALSEQASRQLISEVAGSYGHG